MRKQCEFSWFGQTWKCSRIERSEDHFGGECSMGEKRININSRYDAETFLDYLHHELMEGAIFLSGVCFARVYPDREEIFVMNHSQMDLISGAVRGAYDDIKHKMIPKVRVPRAKESPIQKNVVKAKKPRTKKQ